MKNKNLYYALGAVAVLGVIYLATKKKKEEVVVNLSPPQEADDVPTVSTPPIVANQNSAVSILDKIKEIINAVKNKNTSTPTTNPV